MRKTHPKNKNGFHEAKKPWACIKHHLAQESLLQFLKTHHRAKSSFLVDGFAGPGILEDQSKGFAKISAELTTAHSKFQCINVEWDIPTFQQLEKATAPEKRKIQNIHGDFLEELPYILKSIQGQPAFFYLDPYGIPNKTMMEEISNRQGPTEILLRYDAPQLLKMQNWGTKSPHKKPQWTKIQAKYKSTLEELGITKESSHKPETFIKHALSSHFQHCIPYPIRNPITKKLRYWIIYATNDLNNFLLMANKMYEIEQTVLPTCHEDKPKATNYLHKIPCNKLMTLKTAIAEIIKGTQHQISSKNIAFQLENLGKFEKIKISHRNGQKYIIKTTMKTKVKNIELQEVQLQSLTPSGAAPYSKAILWTPETAQAVLEQCNGRNRACPAVCVTRIATDIKNGNYALTHQGIAFDTKGNLIDGQTRLNAIIESEIPTVLITSFNFPETAHTADENGKLRKTKEHLRTQDMVDHGRLRSFADMLGLEQQKAGEVPTGKTNKTKMVIINRTLRTAIAIGGVPNAQLKSVYDLYEDDINAILAIKDEIRPQSIHSNNIILSCLVFARQINPEKIDEFTKKLFKGTNLEVGDPSYALRNKLMGTPKKGSKNGISKDTYIIQSVCYAIRACLDDKPTEKIHNNDSARDHIRDLTEDTIKIIRKITGTQLPSQEFDFQ